MTPSARAATQGRISWTREARGRQDLVRHGEGDEGGDGAERDEGGAPTRMAEPPRVAASVWMGRGGAGREPWRLREWCDTPSEAAPAPAKVSAVPRPIGPRPRAVRPDLRRRIPGQPPPSARATCSMLQAIIPAYVSRERIAHAVRVEVRDDGRAGLVRDGPDQVLVELGLGEDGLDPLVPDDRHEVRDLGGARVLAGRIHDRAVDGQAVARPAK